MSDHPFQLYCQRVDASKKMARYDPLSIQPTLSGETAVVRAWVRIGSRGGEKSVVFQRSGGRIALPELVRKKRRKG